MKSLMLTLLWLNSLFATTDSDGWVFVERPKSKPFTEALQEEDLSVWVVFAKDLGDEKLLVRFPEDPEYTYEAPDQMKIFSGNHTLQVLKADPAFLEERKLAPDLIEVDESVPHTLDLFYSSEEKWVWERLVLTPNHLYLLKTISDSPLSEEHQYFVDSFDIA